jgi:hypothetical protein
MYIIITTLLCVSFEISITYGKYLRGGIISLRGNILDPVMFYLSVYAKPGN